MQGMKQFHDKFYANPDKQYQDDFIIKYCITANPARKRSINGRGNAKKICIVYRMKDTNDTN